ncbi:hypothetical protein [Nocardia sp. IFM 10818]
MTAPEPRYDLHLTTLTDARESVSQRVEAGLTAADAAQQLIRRAERARAEGALAVKQRWDGVEIQYADQTEFYDVEPVVYHNPAAALPLLRATLTARWPDTQFDVSPTAAADPTSALRIVWSDGPSDRLVQVFAAQIPAKGFHRAGGIQRDRYTTAPRWDEVIAAVESEYQLQVPRDARGRIDWKAAADQPVEVQVTAPDDSDEDAAHLVTRLAVLLHARVYFTDFSAPEPSASTR